MYKSNKYKQIKFQGHDPVGIIEKVATKFNEARGVFQTSCENVKTQKIKNFV